MIIRMYECEECLAQYTAAAAHAPKNCPECGSLSYIGGPKVDESEVESPKPTLLSE